MSAILTLIFFAVPIFAVLIVGFVVYNKLKTSFKSLFGTASISELVDVRAMEIQQTPKSISGMESLERPKIETDFPSMSIDELKSKDIDEIYAYYHALETGDLSRYKDNEQFNDRMKKAVVEAKTDSYSLTDIIIHRQSISRYTRTPENATINIQTSFEGNKKNRQNPQGIKTQLRVETQWVFILEQGNFGQNLTAALNCPNCGAPIANVRDDYCEHCGSNVRIDYSRSWQFSSITEC